MSSKKILFGHKEFISSFILPEWCNGKVLVSAGGDSFIATWLWQSAEEGKELKCKFEVDDLVKDKLNDKHLVPEKFQDDSGNLVEYCISKLVALNKTKQIAVIFERISSVFIFDLSEDGELSFNKEYKVSSDIVTITAAKDQLICSLDDMSQCLEIFDINEDKSLTVSKNASKLIESINNANDSVIGDIDELIPLFNTNYMRKRRLH